MGKKTLRVRGSILLYNRFNALLALFISCCLLSSCATTTAFDANAEYDPSQITTIVLTAGQSNAVGNFSEPNYNGGTQDAPDSRVFVWANVSGTDKWVEAAVLKSGSEQVWIAPKDYLRPGTTTGAIPTGTVDGQSHGGFQIARHIVENSGNIVGIIPTGRSGMPIESWWNGTEQPALTDILNKVKNAIEALKVNHGNTSAKVGLIWWMQGETDAIQAAISGTSNFPDEYIRKLNAILGILKKQTWFYPTNGLYKMFVANHIYEANMSDFNKPGSSFSNYLINNPAAVPQIMENQRFLNEALDEHFDRKTEETAPEDNNGDLEREFLLRCSNVSSLVAVDEDDRIHFDARTFKSIGDSVSKLYLLPAENERCVTLTITQP